MKRLIRQFLILTLAFLMAAGALPAAFAETEGSPAVPGALDRNASAEEILNSMSTRQKIEQCLMMDFRKWKDKDGKIYDMTVLNPDVADILADYQFGSIILFENIKKTDETVELTKAMQAALMSKGGLPAVIAADQEGGIVYRLGSGTALPGNMALGATGDPESAKTAGQIIGRELSSVGINTTLAPVIDVNSNPNNTVIGLRAFSDDADIVGSFGSAFISGLSDYNIIGCAKHYPGHGDTATDSHYGLPVVDKTLEQLMETEFKPYKTAIAQGIDMIMTAHILYPQVDNTTILSDKTGNEEHRPATLSKIFLTDILRDKLGFGGVVITDAMNMTGVVNTFTAEQSTLEALKAGADIICMPVTGYYDKDEVRARLDSVIGTVEAAVANGELPEARLDEAVLRVLKLKKSRGIMEYDPADYTVEKAEAVVGSEENRALEREISAKAVTLIRNDNNVLPYKADKDTKILVMAPYNNERALMVMGVNRAKALGNVDKDAEVRVYRYSADDYTVRQGGELKEALDWADLVIINSEVTGPAGLSLRHWTSLGPMAITSYCRTTGKTSVVMSVDKPFDVQLYRDADAVLAVYGDKGSSMDVEEVLKDITIVADKNACGPNISAGIEVIFGNYSASGRLPVDVHVFDRKTGQFKDEIRYKRGYGLSYVVRPGQAEIKKVKAGKRSISVTAAVSPAKLDADKYQLAYRYTGSSKWHYKTSGSKTVKVKGLKKGRRCVVKLRGISKINGRTYKGPWSRTVKSSKIR